jgi:mono/diheme cytochrome c family protein
MKAIRARSCAALAFTALAILFVSARTDIAAQESKPTDAPAGNAENGKKLFNKIGCYECHGREGQGSTMSGPRIAPDPIPFDALLRYVRNPTGEMPPFTAKVASDQELTDIYAFLKSRPHPQPAKDNPLLK